jgi:hypothetical protein
MLFINQGFKIMYVSIPFLGHHSFSPIYFDDHFSSFNQANDISRQGRKKWDEYGLFSLLGIVNDFNLHCMLKFRFCLGVLREGEGIACIKRKEEAERIESYESGGFSFLRNTKSPNLGKLIESCYTARGR